MNTTDPLTYFLGDRRWRTGILVVSQSIDTVHIYVYRHCQV